MRETIFAKYVFESPSSGYKYVWYGGHGIHVVSRGQEVDFFNVGDWSKDSATLAQVKAGIARHEKEIFENNPPIDSLVKIYDSGPKNFDRYIAVYQPMIVYGMKIWNYLAMSEHPFHPQGFGQHGELKQAPGSYLGKKIKFAQLPPDCQKAVLQDLKE